MLIQVPSNVSWIAATMEDFPELGAPLRITISPKVPAASRAWFMTTIGQP
jgi:hypothetical protein